jgi:hypothetical protein
VLERTARSPDSKTIIPIHQSGSRGLSRPRTVASSLSQRHRFT